MRHKLLDILYGLRLFVWIMGGSVVVIAVVVLLDSL